jgi:hypothetical protein
VSTVWPHWINRESFLATCAFFGIYLGRGRPSRSQVFALELFPGWQHRTGDRLSPYLSRNVIMLDPRSSLSRSQSDERTGDIS